MEIIVDNLVQIWDDGRDGVLALDGFSHHFKSGRLTCLLGPSGCGKSTLAQIVGGTEQATSGQIRIIDPNAPTEAPASIGERSIMMWQNLNLFPWRNVIDNVAFGLEMKGVPRAERHARANELLTTVGLKNFEYKMCSQLSGGMRQRVALARALIMDQPILLMDEPFAALDAMTRDDMQLLLADVWRATRKTVIYVTHNVAEAVYLADRVVVLDDGFQHRRLARDLDIVAIDATDPFGCDLLFPRGLLREPVAGLARAGVVVLTRADAVDEDRRRQIRATVERACGAPPPAWAEAVHRPARLRRFSGPTLPLADLRGQRVFAAAGIGNPAAFRRTLGTLGPSIAGCRWFADHHAYADQDLEEVAAAGRDAGCDLIVTTLKDLVKIRCDELAGLPVVALEIALEMISGGDDIGAAIDRAIAGDVGVHR